MKETAIKASIRWSPVVLRGSLWIAISVLTSFIDKTELLTPAKLATMTWVDWMRLIATICLSGAITFRTFVDQTVARHSDMLADADKAENDGYPKMSAKDEPKMPAPSATQVEGAGAAMPATSTDPVPLPPA